MSAARPFIVLESPFAGGGNMTIFARNLAYLRRCLRHSWEQGELPLASHAYFPFFLDEDSPAERKAGIEAGYSLWPLASKVVFYADYGLSDGMSAALDRAVHHRKEVFHRLIGANP